MSTPVATPQRPLRALRRVASVVALLAVGLAVREATVGAAQDPTSCPSDKIALVNGGFEEPSRRDERVDPLRARRPFRAGRPRRPTAASRSGTGRSAAFPTPRAPSTRS